MTCFLNMFHLYCEIFKFKVTDVVKTTRLKTPEMKKSLKTKTFKYNNSYLTQTIFRKMTKLKYENSKIKTSGLNYLGAV